MIRAPEPSDDVITLKGLTPSVRVWRRSVGVDRMLASGTLARAGDLLVLEVAPVTAGHAVLLSIDGAGKVTLHHPSTPTADTRVTGAAFFVDGGYTLDDAPGFERFVLVTADEAIDVGAVLAAGQVVALGSIARSGPLELAPHLKQAPFMVVKSQGHSVSPRDGGREPGLDD